MPDTDYGTEWVRLDTGLRYDDRFNGLSIGAQWLWLRMYLVCGSRGGFLQSLRIVEQAALAEAMPHDMTFRDYGGPDIEESPSAEAAGAWLDELEQAGMFEEVEGRGWTVRGFTKWQKRLDRGGAERKRRSRARAKEEGGPKPTPFRPLKAETPKEPEGGWHGAGQTLEQLVPRPPK